jgi:putative MATE family efflux protein
VDDHGLKEPGAREPASPPGGQPPLAVSRAPGAPPPAAHAPGSPPELRRPVWRLVLLLAWPVLIQQCLVLAVSLSDRLLAGRFQETGPAEQAASLAAQTTASYLAWLLTSCTVLVSVGSTALVARFVGAGDRRGARRVANQSFLLAVALGAAGTAVGLVLLRPVLGLMQLHGLALDFAVAYLRPMLLLLVFQVVGAAGIGCLVGAGDTRTGMWALGGVALLNLPLAWLFFHGLGPLPGRGFPGIGLGTAVSQALGGLAVFLVLVRGRAGLRLHLRLLRPRLDLQRRLLRVSAPAAFDSLSMAVGYCWFLSIINGLGDVATAAHGIALTWEALGYQLGVAFGTAATALVGQHLGAGQPDRAAHSGWVALGMGVGLMSTMGALFFSLAVPMFGLFCPHEGQAPIVETGVPLLRLVAFSMPALATCMVLTSALRGAGDTRVPLLFTWVGFFAVRVPLAYALTAAGLGVFGAWVAMVSDVHVRGLLVLARYAGGRWARVRV